MRVEIMVPRRDGSGPFTWKWIEMEWIPFQNEAFTVGRVGLAVVQRGFNFIENKSNPLGPEWTQECGLLCQQVAGPPIIEPATLAEVQKLGLQS
jgi:hypothetical protein